VAPGVLILASTSWWFVAGILHMAVAQDGDGRRLKNTDAVLPLMFIVAAVIAVGTLIFVAILLVFHRLVTQCTQEPEPEAQPDAKQEAPTHEFEEHPCLSSQTAASFGMPQGYVFTEPEKPELQALAPTGPAPIALDLEIVKQLQSRDAITPLQLPAEQGKALAFNKPPLELSAIVVGTKPALELNASAFVTDREMWSVDRYSDEAKKDAVPEDNIEIMPFPGPGYDMLGGYACKVGGPASEIEDPWQVQIMKKPAGNLCGIGCSTDACRSKS